MSFGKITKIDEDPATKTMYGELKDLETKKQYSFRGEANIPTVTRQDVVNFTDNGGIATDLTPNLAVKLKDLATASQDVQDAVATLLLAMSKDKNMTDVICRKF